MLEGGLVVPELIRSSGKCAKDPRIPADRHICWNCGIQQVMV